MRKKGNPMVHCSNEDYKDTFFFRLLEFNNLLVDPENMLY